MAKIIDGERAYPIYVITAKWQEDGVQNPQYPKSFEGLPEGRIHNSTSFQKMYKRKQTPQEIKQFLLNWWTHFINGKRNSSYPIVNPTNLELAMKLKSFEPWCLTWFSHETFDYGQTDEQVLESFYKYTTRIQEYNEQAERNGQPIISLMGAEDRWRWRGDPTIDNSPAPCRCEHCKQAGKIRISH